MKGFILANGHSGTTWAAKALTECTDLTARHESWRHSIGKDFGGVESNGNLWNRGKELEALFPGVPRIHLVRDGRKVVRTIMTRKPSSFFEAACRRWNSRNERLFVEICNANRFRLEDLVDKSGFHTFSSFARKLGATKVDRGKWEQWRSIKIRPSNHIDLAHFPSYPDWTDEQKEIFRNICGDMMKSMGYDRFRSSGR